MLQKTILHRAALIGVATSYLIASIAQPMTRDELDVLRAGLCDVIVLFVESAPPDAEFSEPVMRAYEECKQS